MRIVLSAGWSSCRHRAICCGLHARAQRRFCRGPCRRPFQGTVGPDAAVPPGAATVPASPASCSSCHRRGWVCTWRLMLPWRVPVCPFRDRFSWRSTSSFLRPPARSAWPRACACPTPASRTCSCACVGPKRTASPCARTAAARSAPLAGGRQARCGGAARRAATTSRSPPAPCSPGTSCRCGPTCWPWWCSATRSRARACSPSPVTWTCNTRRRSCWRTSCARPWRPASRGCVSAARAGWLRSTARISAATCGRRTGPSTGSTGGDLKTNLASAAWGGDAQARRPHPAAGVRGRRRRRAGHPPADRPGHGGACR